MASVALTGAAGNVGREALVALREAGHDVTPITHRERNMDSVVLDVTDAEAVDAALAGQDAVVHLAGNPSPDAEWDSVLDVNVDGTQIVYEAALSNDLDRVVFASTNHVTQMHNVADPAVPESMREDADAVHPDDRDRPDSFYAVSKVTGEALGSYYADRHGLEVVNLRIGWLLDRDGLREKQSLPEEKARYARAMWLSPRDCQDALRRSVAADVETPLTVNVVSRNAERYLSLTETTRGIGYAPRDDSAEVLE